MKKSMIDRISRKKMSRSRIKNCGDTKWRVKTNEPLNSSFISTVQKDNKGG